MTPREQVAFTLFGIIFGGTGILLALDILTEKIGDYLARERAWRMIEMNSSRERHPSFRAPLFDQDKGGNL